MRCDCVVIGGGHNGLVAAAYLARRGLKTILVERRPLLGGACVTEELWPGYRVSRAAYVAGLLRPAVIRELSLERHGLELLRRDPSSYTPLRDGRGLLLGSDPEATHQEIARFSPRDAARYPEYESMLDQMARTLEPLLDVAPPDPARPRLADLAPAWQLARGAFGMRRNLARSLQLLLGPARSALESWFESEPLRGTLATDAVIGAWASPSTPGTGYVLFHHVMGETGGARGVWAYVRGGMGALSEAIASAARAAGAEILTDAPVARVNLDGNRAVGVELEDGRSIEARAIVSGVDPHRTFLDLVGPDALPAELVSDVESIDYRSPSVKINLALDGLPCFRGGVEGRADPQHRGTIHVGAQTLDELEDAFAAAAAGRIPNRPMVELTLPSVLDPGLAPDGHHVGSMFVQYAPQGLDSTAWNALREVLADRVFAMVDEIAPGFSQRVVHREVLAPPDLERIFGLKGGNIFHGAMGLDRLAFMRPAPGWAQYKTPIESLYLCGAGAHPGGGVMGACGRNAAAQIIQDLG